MFLEYLANLKIKKFLLNQILSIHEYQSADSKIFLEWGDFKADKLVYLFLAKIIWKL